MREIRFRAWDKVNEKMIFGNELQLSLNGLNLWVLDQIYKDEFTLGNINDYKLMQYTGLKDDETGKDVYQGDIVNLYWSDAIGEPHFEKVVMKNPFEYSSEEAMYFVHADMLEVIGNIYENPELLEVRNG